MDKREKVDFILEQMRLCLAKSDYIRTQIISKKINIKFFQDKENEVSPYSILYAPIHANNFNRRILNFDSMT